MCKADVIGWYSEQLALFLIWKASDLPVKQRSLPGNILAYRHLLSCDYVGVQDAQG